MKTINAATPSSRFASSDLNARRFYPNLDAAAIKRQERRKSRRQLDAELRGTVYHGIHRDFGMSRLDVMEKVRSNQARSHHEFLFQEFIKDTERPLVQRPVTVIRKSSAYRRSTVETLMVPA